MNGRVFPLLWGFYSASWVIFMLFKVFNKNKNFVSMHGVVYDLIHDMEIVFGVYNC